MATVDIRVGQVYEDCSLHPVFCTESDGDDLAGVSLYDGSGPRSCSIRHCAPRALSVEEVIALVSRRKDFLQLEAEWQTAFQSGNAADYDYYGNVNRLREELGLPHV